MSDRQLSTTEMVVLGLVALGEQSGYDLALVARQSVGYLWTPSRSQIYKVLPRLVGYGMARARDVPQRDRPDKALYKITPAGHRALRAWLEQVDDEPPGGPNIFALKLFFCDLVPPRTAQGQLDGYRRFLETRLRRFTSMQLEPEDTDSLFPQLILRRAIARIQATLIWVEEARQAIEARHGRAAARSS
jgi:DNA-binding PadR family transcriptional regulator